MIKFGHIRNAKIAIKAANINNTLNTIPAAKRHHTCAPPVVDI
jgi:hypothetical protein